MKSLLEYITEQILLEYNQMGDTYFNCKSTKVRSNPRLSKFNFIATSGGHAVERGVERKINNDEVTSLILDCWERIKKGYESGKYLAAKYDTNEVGSVIGLHSTERTPEGYLTVILTIKKYHPTADYFELEVVTVCKTKTMDGWKEKTEDGKTLNHPERGQLNLWDQEGIHYRGKQDD